MGNFFGGLSQEDKDELAQLTKDKNNKKAEHEAEFRVMKDDHQRLSRVMEQRLNEVNDRLQDLQRLKEKNATAYNDQLRQIAAKHEQELNALRVAQEKERAELKLKTRSDKRQFRAKINRETEEQKTRHANEISLITERKKKDQQEGMEAIGNARKELEELMKKKEGVEKENEKKLERMMEGHRTKVEEARNEKDQQMKTYKNNASKRLSSQNEKVKSLVEENYLRVVKDANVAVYLSFVYDFQALEEKTRGMRNQSSDLLEAISTVPDDDADDHMMLIKSLNSKYEVERATVECMSRTLIDKIKTNVKVSREFETLLVTIIFIMEKSCNEGRAVTSKIALAIQNENTALLEPAKEPLRKHLKTIDNALQKVIDTDFRTHVQKAITSGSNSPNMIR